MQIQREHDAEREWNDDAGRTDRERRARTVAQPVEVHLHANHEHEEHDAKLTD